MSEQKKRPTGLSLTAALMLRLGADKVFIDDAEAEHALDGFTIRAYRDEMRLRTVVELKPEPMTGILVDDPEAAQATQSATTLIFSNK